MYETYTVRIKETGKVIHVDLGRNCSRCGYCDAIVFDDDGQFGYGDTFASTQYTFMCYQCMGEKQMDFCGYCQSIVPVMMMNIDDPGACIQCLPYEMLECEEPHLFYQN